MKEYIEREDVIKKISGLTVNISGGRRNAKEICAEAIKFYHQAILQCVNVSPAVDVVEVVRCKDCEHYGANKTYRPQNFKFAFCYKFHHNITTDNDFCSYGERKGD